MCDAVKGVVSPRQQPLLAFTLGLISRIVVDTMLRWRGEKMRPDMFSWISVGFTSASMAKN